MSCLSSIYISTWLIPCICLSRADTLINKMIKYAINRAIATSFCAVAGVILVRVIYVPFTDLIMDYYILVLLLLWDILLVSGPIMFSRMFLTVS